MIPDNDDFKSGFYIPENVYIIGTMNDIDRSVDAMDFAMRRRFSFLEVKANEREDMWTEDWKDLAKACMEAINEKIEEIPGLSPSYHIGPAYFKKLNGYSLSYDGKVYGYDFFKLWENHISGVIFEYLRGKKDAKDTVNNIYYVYLNALTTQLNKRFNKGGLWGELCFDSKGKVTDVALNTFNVSDGDGMVEYLNKCHSNKFEELVTSAKESLSKRSIEKNKEAEIANTAIAMAIDKLKLSIDRAMRLGKDIEEKMS